MKWITGLFLVLFTLDATAEEDRKNNPLYKSLTNIELTLNALKEVNLARQEFVPISFKESLQTNWSPTNKNYFQDSGIQIAERNFNKFCTKITNGSKNFRDLTIPRIIHFIWLGSPPPQKVILAIDSWRKYHPTWEIKLWTEKELKNFLWTTSHARKFFDESKNWAEKSDILRFDILYQYGGIYADTDIMCFKSFEDLVSNGIVFFAGLESNIIKRYGRPLVGSSLIGVAKNNPIMLRCMDFSKTLNESPTTHQHIRSGPGAISSACYEALETSRKENILILPCSYFYPLPWEERLASPRKIVESIRPESFVVHLWEGSWFDDYQ